MLKEDVWREELVNLARFIFGLPEWNILEFNQRGRLAAVSGASASRAERYNQAITSHEPSIVYVIKYN